LSLLLVTMCWRSSGGNHLEKVAEVADDEEAAQDGMLALE